MELTEITSWENRKAGRPFLPSFFSFFQPHYCAGMYYEYLQGTPKARQHEWEGTTVGGGGEGKILSF